MNIRRGQHPLVKIELKKKLSLMGVKHNKNEKFFFRDDEWEHFGVKLELRLSRGGIISSRVLEIRNRKWDMGNRKWDMGLWLLKMRNCLKPNN